MKKFTAFALIAWALSGCTTIERAVVASDDQGQRIWVRTDAYDGVSSRRMKTTYLYCKSGDKEGLIIPRPVCVEAEYIDVRPSQVEIGAPVPKQVGEGAPK